MTLGTDIQEFSILRGCSLRPLHLVVAQQLASTEPGDPRWATLLRLYKALPDEQRSKCKSALVGCHA
jgi:hypothetical protein